jgi:hypothetical protein
VEVAGATERKFRMRRTSSAALVSLGLVGSVLLAPQALAGTRSTVDFTDVRGFVDRSSAATTDLPGCATATGVDLRANLAFPPPHGVFIGIRDFQCGDGTGFVVRLTATFTDEGSTGSWSIVDAYGDLAGLQGSGKLVGTPTGTPEAPAISDHYTGWITWH